MARVMSALGGAVADKEQDAVSVGRTEQVWQMRPVRNAGGARRWCEWNEREA